MGLTLRARPAPAPLPVIFLPPALQLPSWSRWAEEQFGEAALGHVARTRRLVALAARVGAHPAGTVTEVFGADAPGRELAYDWLENDDVRPAEVAAAHHRATARRSGDERFVFVPVDGSSLTLTDRDKSKGLGQVGTSKAGARGLKVLSALALTPEGVPVGLLAQRWWVRMRTVSRHRAERQTHEKELQHWLDVMAEAEETLQQHAPGTAMWAQLDAEGSAWPVLEEAGQQVRWLTVRARHDRRLWLEADDADESADGRMLWEALETRALEATYEMRVEGTKQRAERTAHMTLRYAEVTLRLRDKVSGQRWPRTMFAVLAREEGTTPKGETPLEWLLLTTYPIESVQEACLVVFGYTLRWRIEQFHEALKAGGCNVEDTQLRDALAIERWAAIHSAVATRLLRLTYLARHEPNTPATRELSEGECRALEVETGVCWRGDEPTLFEAVVALGRAGGYTGQGAGQPPGFTVLARGLKTIGALARAFDRGAVRAKKAHPRADPSDT